MSLVAFAFASLVLTAALVARDAELAVAVVLVAIVPAAVPFIVWAAAVVVMGNAHDQREQTQTP